jgi:subtilisin family serine protease
MRFKTILVAVVLLTSTVAAPAMAAGPSQAYQDKLGPGLVNVDTWTGYDTSDIFKYSGNPGVFVTVDEGKMDSLRAWANVSTDREILAIDNASNRALVAAPPADLLGGVRFDEASIAGREVPWPTFGGGLVSRAYVLTMAADQRLTQVDPILSLAPATSYSAPVGHRFVTLFDGEAAFTAAGQAWRADANRSTLAEAQVAIDADGTKFTGEGVRVAVIDSGMIIENMTDDPLYQGRILAPKNTITNETGAAAVATESDHGAWVAAAIAANPKPGVRNEPMEGVAPNATIIPIKALSAEGGSTQDIVEAIEHASQYDADIISMSLGSPVYTPVVAAEIQEFFEEGGTAVIVAVGNSKMNPALRYISSPADVDGVIAVAATNVSGPETAAPAYFSDVGPDNGVSDLSNGVTNGEAPDIAAPGMNITAPVSATRNVTLSGTSMSTPLVAGVAALTLEANPELEGNHEKFREVMLEAARPIPAAGVTEVGNGMVSAANATATNVVETSQEAARTDLAKARDAANRAYSGSSIVRVWLDVTGGAAA